MREIVALPYRAQPIMHLDFGDLNRRSASLRKPSIDPRRSFVQRSRRQTSIPENGPGDRADNERVQARSGYYTFLSDGSKLALARSNRVSDAIGTGRKPSMPLASLRA